MHSSNWTISISIPEHALFRQKEKEERIFEMSCKANLQACTVSFGCPSALPLQSNLNSAALDLDSSLEMADESLHGHCVPVGVGGHACARTNIPSGGTLVIGREQDCVGGCFESLAGAAGSVTQFAWFRQDFFGLIDEMRIWKTVRTQEEIRQVQRCQVLQKHFAAVKIDARLFCVMLDSFKEL